MVKKTKNRTRKWAKLVRFFSYIMMFYAVVDTIRVLYDFMTKPHIEFTIDHDFDDNSSTVRVKKQHLIGFWLMRLVSNFLIFL